MSPRTSKGRNKIVGRTPRKLGHSTKHASQSRRKLGEEQSVLQKFQIKTEADGSESDKSLGEIKEARIASRKAIDMLMADLRRQKKVNTWVPGGSKGKIFHANA